MSDSPCLRLIWSPTVIPGLFCSVAFSRRCIISSFALLASWRAVSIWPRMSSWFPEPWVIELAAMVLISSSTRGRFCVLSLISSRAGLVFFERCERTLCAVFSDAVRAVFTTWFVFCIPLVVASSMWPKIRVRDGSPS